MRFHWGVNYLFPYRVKGEDEINEKVAKIISENVNLFKLISGYATYHIGNKAIVELYCEVEDMGKRADIHSKFECDDILTVYILPIEESHSVTHPGKEFPKVKRSHAQSYQLSRKVSGQEAKEKIIDWLDEVGTHHNTISEKFPGNINFTGGHKIKRSDGRSATIVWDQWYLFMLTH
uniref:Coproporphyrinogen oxidase n=1 Tax=Caenorhabditis tropicalis TaxID=1561998 RepID=A0A1I7TB93_9PELO